MKSWIEKNKNLLALMLCIATIPMVWAVFSPGLGISTGGVSLICAALYTANGNKRKDGLKLSLGFLFGDLWAVLLLYVTQKYQLHSELLLFCTLFVFGATAVLFSDLFKKVIHLPSWLCGWAIGMLIMAPQGFDKLSNLPVQIGIAMLVGVWYIGEGVNIAHNFLCRNNKNE